MTDRAINMKAPEVLALRAGRKVEHRLLAWGKRYSKGFLLPTPWQKVRAGERLWVRETWAPVPNSGSHDWDSTRAYKADLSLCPETPWCHDELIASISKWRPFIHMPRWASRLTLVVTEARLERLRDITVGGCRAEGCTARLGRLSSEFRDLWNSLHGPGAWEANPEVVALRFEVHQSNIDSMERAA